MSDGRRDDELLEEEEKEEEVLVLGDGVGECDVGVDPGSLGLRGGRLAGHGGLGNEEREERREVRGWGFGGMEVEAIEEEVPWNCT